MKHDHDKLKAAEKVAKQSVQEGFALVDPDVWKTLKEWDHTTIHWSARGGGKTAKMKESMTDGTFVVECKSAPPQIIFDDYAQDSMKYWQKQVKKCQLYGDFEPVKGRSAPVFKHEWTRSDFAQAVHHMAQYGWRRGSSSDSQESCLLSALGRKYGVQWHQIVPSKEFSEFCYDNMLESLYRDPSTMSALFGEQLVYAKADPRHQLDFAIRRAMTKFVHREGARERAIVILFNDYVIRSQNHAISIMNQFIQRMHDPERMEYYDAYRYVPDFGRAMA